MISGLLENESPYATKVFLAVLILTCMVGTVYIKPLSAISALLHVSNNYDPF
jgi:hypothetical protein